MMSHGHHPAMAHFQRFGPLAYRLALAMLGNEEAAARTLEEVFAGFGKDGALWPQWHVALDAVHRQCITAMAETQSAGRPAPGAPSSPILGEDDDIVPLPASTLHGAFSALSTADQKILWTALTSTTAAASNWELLADALRRLEIAISNEDIPAEEESDWHL
jgi:hypothetical protein